LSPFLCEEEEEEGGKKRKKKVEEDGRTPAGLVVPVIKEHGNGC